MASRYGQYCPLSIATELLGERWTILVVMQVIEGTARFADMQRALPKISPSTLTTRLRALEEAELVERRRAASGEVEYRPTAAALDLEPILIGLAQWGQRWGRDMQSEDLDPEFLAWSMHRRIDLAAMPEGRVVIEFEFSGVPGRFCQRFWLVKQGEGIDVCIKHPGHEVDVRVQAELRRFIEAWRGFRSLEAELKGRHIRVEGPPALRRGLARWLLGSMIADVPRERAGHERSVRARSLRSAR